MENQSTCIIFHQVIKLLLFGKTSLLKAILSMIPEIEIGNLFGF
jgi:hypothetical protein